MKPSTRPRPRRPSPPSILFPAALAGLLFFLGGGALPGQTTAPGSLLTRAEITDFVETSSYQEVMALSQRLAGLSDEIHLTSFGYTNEGRPLPLLVVGAPGPGAEAVLGTGKTRVYLQGNIHAGEVCGKEALLMLVREYARGGYPAWTDDLVLLVAPIYNADGNERIDLRNRPRQHGPSGAWDSGPTPRVWT
ncbi:MAG: M14 family zinc carboxypeptidase [Longimicrobiales bacterium]|nr:M14 family zinc carboxypeptidase [Longimicrobiales bacterium]